MARVKAQNSFSLSEKTLLFAGIDDPESVGEIILIIFLSIIFKPRFKVYVVSRNLDTQERNHHRRDKSLVSGEFINLKGSLN